MQSKKKTVLLVGAGHSHLEVLKNLSKREVAQNRWILISPFPQTYYSGLLPRFIAGQIQWNQLMIPSAAYAHKKGVEFFQDRAESIRFEEKTVVLKSGRIERFDLLSLNTGGLSAHSQEDFSPNIVDLRPIEQFYSRFQVFEKQLTPKRSVKVVVIGGGAGAVEVSTALRIRLNRDSSPASELHLITSGCRLCENYSPRISSEIHEALSRQGVNLHFQERVTEFSQNHFILSKGERMEYDFLFLATPTKTRGKEFEIVDSKLRLAPTVFAVGDCMKMGEFPELPRSGVVAVHQGRVLAQSIRQLLENQEPEKYTPQKKFLNILISGEKTARLVWGESFSLEGKLPFIFKNWIDRRYLRQFKTLDL